MAFCRFQDVVIDLNTTRSEMSFVPTIEDDGKTITCRAENPKVTGQFVETHWKLNVVCKYYFPTRSPMTSVDRPLKSKGFSCYGQLANMIMKS